MQKKPPFSPGSMSLPPSEGGDGTLTSDRMMMAMAEGRMDEFLAERFGDNEQARHLAMMMMGMSGVGPGTAPIPPMQPTAAAGETVTSREEPAGKEAEHEKNLEKNFEKNFDRTAIDRLVEIAAENDVTVDWLMARAIRLYVRDHDATGRL